MNRNTYQDSTQQAEDLLSPERTTIPQPWEDDDEDDDNEDKDNDDNEEKFNMLSQLCTHIPFADPDRRSARVDMWLRLTYRRYT